MTVANTTANRNYYLLFLIYYFRFTYVFIYELEKFAFNYLVGGVYFDGRYFVMNINYGGYGGFTQECFIADNLLQFKIATVTKTHNW